MTDNLVRPPDAPGPLAAWFAEAVRGELAALEKSGGTQAYEVLSGSLLESTGPARAIYQFIIADATRIPEDARGRLKTNHGDYPTTILRQIADRIDLDVEGVEPILPSIPHGMLFVDDTALLRRLAEVLGVIVANPAAVSPLAVTIFHPHRAQIGLTTATESLTHDDQEKRHVISQACGSSLTYVWGPPGTGKTHLIAHLVAELVRSGERVLVTSHTHAAVDQVIYASLNEDDPGPLAGNALLSEGKIIRVGQTVDRRVPASVRLDNVVDAKAGNIQTSILELERNAQPLSNRLASCKERIAEWERLRSLTEQLREARITVANADAAYKDTQASVDQLLRIVQRRREDVDRAQRAWFFRQNKVRRAHETLRSAEEALRTSEDQCRNVEIALTTSQGQADAIESVLAEARVALIGAPALSVLKAELTSVEAELQPLLDQIQELKDRMGQLQQHVIAEACVIFCTLTKNYMGKELETQSFDAVIVDEISMALPPLLFLAGRRATSRVILVGDFLQLPPIIRSDTNITNERLRKDAFALSGIVNGLKPVQHSQVLTSLTIQRRMQPPIADAARHLAYDQDRLRLEDHPSVRTRTVPSWLDFLPENALVIVDTADLRCWSGKQPGTLSRFNFYSANLAVELAGMAAAALSAPREDQAPIGIVTPYAAQRKLLMRLVNAFDLSRWAAAGTVHTFQGSQADLIVFDCVLDEPYWSSRLTSPDRSEDVLRDLNVGVTRAKFKFVFVGSSEWLNQHARPTSALGRLWTFLKDRADLVSAVDLVEQNFAQRVAAVLDDTMWRVPEESGQAAHELLDEQTFFDRFTRDLESARSSIFGLVPYFGEYRWPKIEPYFRAALEKGIAVTFVTPPMAEADNAQYVEQVVRILRDLGAVVIPSSGLHGKDIVIDERILYTGSLNWASHRGRAEIMHRTEDPKVARLVLDFIQAKHIRHAAVHDDGNPRACPECKGPTHLVNQRVQSRFDMRQALKIGCAQYQRTGCKYLRDVDERAPFKTVPLCKRDGRTKYRRARRGRGEVWQCPKHPRECPTEKVVPGDPG